MRIKYFDIARVYLIVSSFIFLLSSFWPGPSLVLITDVLIIIVVLDILLKKQFNHDMKWIIILMALSLLQMFLVMAKQNGDIVIFLHSRTIFVYILITFFYMYTFSKLDNSNLKKMSYLIEVIIKIQIVAIVADGIAINFIGMQTLFTNVFQSSIGNYSLIVNPGIVFPKVPNGLVFGAQHASILSVVGILWYLPGIKKINNKYLSQCLWLILSIIALVFSITTTAILTLTITLLIALSIILLKKNKITLLVFTILAPFVIGMFFERVISFLKNIIIMRYHISSEFLFELQLNRYYSKMVEQPINAFSEYFSDILIGVGRTPQELNIVGEIGFISIMVDYGLVFFGILLFSFSFFMLKTIYVITTNNVKNEENNIIFRLILISLAIVLSLMHYTTFYVPGVKQLFAAVIALLYVLIKKHKRIPQKTLHLSL